MTKMTEMTAPISMVALSKLRYASEAPPELGLQVRKSDDAEGLAELEASVRAHGVIVPLVLKKANDGLTYVTAGNRRLKVARRIYGDIDAHVPCVDSDHFGGDPREIAMATNVALPPHPVDRYEVITSLVREGMTPADAQMRFGMSQRQLAQVMKLGALSQEVLDHYRAGRIDGKTAQAFTLASTSEQNRVYAVLAKRAQQVGGRVIALDVVNEVVGVKQRNVGPLVKFVGIDACRKAKILKQEDLFSNHHAVTDPRALKRMVDRRLSEKCDELCKGGWAWAFPEDEVPGNRWAYTMLGPTSKFSLTLGEEAMVKQLQDEARRNEEAAAFDQALADELQRKLEQVEQAAASRRYSAEQKARSGCFVSVSRDGSLSIEYGRVKPEDSKKAIAAERREAAKPAAKKAAKPGDAALTGALATRMSENLQKAASSVLQREPAIAAAAIIAACASNGSVLDIRVGGGGDKKPSTFESVFAGAMKASSPELLSMLAQVAAVALDVVTYNPEAMPMTHRGKAALLNALPPARLEKATRETFDAVDYFASVSLASVVEAVRTSMSDDHAGKVAKMRKADAAKFAAANVPETGWLPKQLRTAHYTGPVEPGTMPAASRPAAKKKAAKKPVAKKKAKA
jgi:ParB family transcriptional regulator, chromosome partitioning protein